MKNKKIQISCGEVECLRLWTNKVMVSSVQTVAISPLPTRRLPLSDLVFIIIPNIHSILPVFPLPFPVPEQHESCVFEMYYIIYLKKIYEYQRK